MLKGRVGDVVPWEASHSSAATPINVFCGGSGGGIDSAMRLLAANLACQMSKMLQLMLLLQLRKGGFVLIYNNWWLLRCAMDKRLIQGLPAVNPYAHHN
jgi:hypothetical protein